ncbi:MAG: DUF1330 domain-containing protein [Pseudomonadota bacterium]
MRPAKIPVRSAVLIMLGCFAGCGGLPPAESPCEPVVMVVTGVTHDRQRMADYARAIADSGLYPSLAGYYMNDLRPIDIFEGTLPANHSTLMVRFPNLEAARHFWFSSTYQNEIRPLRLNPNAGDYTVSVYRESALPAYMADKWSPGQFDPSVCQETR